MDAASSLLSSRQKNCNGCVQVKRRCDRRAPICSRCIEKKIPCVYSRRKTDRYRDHSEPSATTAFESGHYASDPGQAKDLDFLGTLNPFEPMQNYGVDSTIDDFGMDSFLDIMPTRDQWLIQNEEMPSISGDEAVKGAYEKMGHFCVSLRCNLLSNC